MGVGSESMRPIRRDCRHRDWGTVLTVQEHQFWCPVAENPRTFNNLGERIFRLVGCSDVLVPVGIKVRAKTQPNPRL